MRRTGPTSVIAAVLVAAMVTLTAAGCGASSESRRTITKTVTADTTAAPPPGSTSEGTNPAITVIDPGTTGGAAPSTPHTTGSPTTGASSTPGASTGASTDPDAATTGNTSATGTSATTNTAARAASDILDTACAAILSYADISTALGDPLPADHLRISDVPNPSVDMTGRTKCYYGTDNLDDAQPLVVALAAYASTDAADDQMNVTVNYETDAGAQTSTVQVAGNPAYILLRDGGMIITRIGAWTLTVALAKGVVSVDALPKALTSLAKSAMERLG